MRLISTISVAAAVLCVVGPAWAGTCSPPVQLSPMPGFERTSCESWKWDEVELLVDYDADTYRTIAGGHWQLEFWLSEGAARPSPPQIVRNLAGALAPLGGRVVWRTEDGVLIQLQQGGATTWVHGNVSNDGEIYQLNIVREAPMHQEMVADAGILAAGIRSSGKATLTGVHFDLDSDHLRPDSDAALAQAATLLRQQPDLRLWVVGHTDASGSFEHNLDLSGRRAAAVVRALVERYHVAASRLEPHGVGPLAPVTSNATKEGRALNRRVELVAR